MIKTLLNADNEEFCREMEESDRAMRFHFAHPILSAISGWFSEWYIRLVLCTICKIHGHNLIDDGSYANPDSGGEGFRCTRCGWSWWHQYY